MIMQPTLNQYFIRNIYSISLHEREYIMKKGRLILMLFLAYSLSACNTLDQSSKTNTCPLPPAGFTKAELIGTWASGNEDTLILRANSTYKQIMHVPTTPRFDYESDWLPWSITYSEDGMPYLHLRGMRLCKYWDGVDCQQIGGGKESWYDYCKKEWVQMPDEGILIVVGPPKGLKLPPPGFHLAPLTRSTDGTTSYEFQEP
jgi:hypothetical protein